MTMHLMRGEQYLTVACVETPPWHCGDVRGPGGRAETGGPDVVMWSVTSWRTGGFRSMSRTSMAILDWVI